MENHDGHVHVDEVEASGGSKEGVVRWVLIGGMVLAILLLSIVWIVPAMNTGDVEEEGTVSGQISSMEDEGDGTDSIVGTGPSTEIGGQDPMAAEVEAQQEDDALETIPN